MTWLAPKAGRNGRLLVSSDAAIQLCLLVKVLPGPPLRQTPGRVARLLSMAGPDWPVPDLSALSRRQKRITVRVSSRHAPGPLDLLVDIEPAKRHRFGRTGEGGSGLPGMGNGMRASMARSADANIARSIVGKTQSQGI